jgi:hypothetical protein
MAFRRRAAIEPVIGYVKSDHRLNRNFCKGLFGDDINVLLARRDLQLQKENEQVETLVVFQVSEDCVT